MRILVVLAAAASLLGAADNELTPQEKKAGWKLMFDGKTFAGWEDPAKKSPPGNSYSIVDGCLKSTRRPIITEDLFTTDKYTDFEMEFDWKISVAGNSGVKYRIQDTIMLPPAPRGMKFEDFVFNTIKAGKQPRAEHSQDYVVGFEYQCIDNERHPDGKRGPIHQSGALYDIFPPTKDATKPVGEFNHSRIVVKGDHIEHWLNGEKVVDGSLKDPAVATHSAARWGTESPVYKLLVEQPKKSCPISLQNHGDEAWFKNLKIRKL